MTRTWLRRDPHSLAVGFWMVLALVVGLRMLLSPEKHTVFPIFAASAAHWWADQSLYEWRPPLDLFRYPPPFPVAITPFAVLGLRFGGLLWSWVSMAIYAVGLSRFARHVLPPDWSRGRSAAFLALGAVVALPGLWNAQSNMLVVGLLLLAASGVARQRWWTASILLSAAIWIKLTPLVPALLLCALWPRRLAPRLIVALLVGAALPFLTRPADIVLGHYGEWVASLAESGGNRWPGFRDGWTLWLVVRHLWEGTYGPLVFLQRIDSVGYPALQLATAALTLLWCLWQRNRKLRIEDWELRTKFPILNSQFSIPGDDRRRLVCVAVGMATAWLMLFGPAIEHATYAFLAPSLSWALLERSTRVGSRWLIGSAFVLIAILGWEPITHPLLDHLPLLLAALPLGTILFIAWLIGCANGSVLPTSGVVNDLPAFLAGVPSGAACTE